MLLSSGSQRPGIAMHLATQHGLGIDSVEYVCVELGEACELSLSSFLPSIAHRWAVSSTTSRTMPICSATMQQAPASLTSRMMACGSEYGVDILSHSHMQRTKADTAHNSTDGPEPHCTPSS